MKSRADPNMDSKKLGYSLCSINICGMSKRSRFALDNFCYEKSIDILAVQESFTSDDSNLDLKFMNHVCDGNMSVNRGAMLYVNSTKFNMTSLPTISECSKNIDTVWCIVTGKAFRYIIGSIYLKLNCKDAVSDLFQMLEKAKQLSVQLKAKGVIAFGDYNARHKMWGDMVENSYGSKISSELNFQDFTIMSSLKPTFLSENGNSFIDFVIVSNTAEQLLTDVRTDNEAELFSGAPMRGHVPILTEYKVNCNDKIVTPPKLRFDISTIEWTQWASKIEEKLYAQESNLSTFSAADQWKWINDAIHTATSSCASYKRSTMYSKPFWTKELTKMSLALRSAKKSYSKRNTLSNKVALDHAKEIFDDTRKCECQKFLLDRTKNLSTAQANKFWKEFNSLFARKITSKVDHLRNDNGELLTDDKEMEDILFYSFFEGKHLQEKGKDFDDRFYQEVNILYEQCLLNCSHEQDLNSPLKKSVDELNQEITESELLYYISKYKTAGKSFDNYEFHPVMLQKLGPVALRCILDLFNKCLTSGEWVWNVADVIFLKKDGKKDFSKAGSYRPISITSYIGKVFEQIIAGRLETYLQNIGLHDETQEGFTKGRNTSRYLNRLDNDIRYNRQKKLTVICLFLDFEKAFDSVWKKGLLKKLNDHGVSGNVWKLINGFLFSRKVRLVFNDFTGFVRTCREFGLPQGSALSPILFKFFIHDLAINLSTNPNVESFKFADDGTFRVIGESTPICLENLRLTCDVIYQWSITWRMVMNCEADKTELIAFNTAEKDSSLIPESFELGSSKISFVDKTKVLGLTMDKKLSYIDHAKSVKTKVVGRWATICKYTNRNWGFKQHVIVRLIEVLLYTRIHYAGTVWINDKTIRELESSWYRPIKAALGAIFHVKHSLAEAIMGVLPIQISNKVNSIKHFLKLNILPCDNDPLKRLVEEQIQDNQHSRIHTRIKHVFQFLEWKLSAYPNKFSYDEKNIIANKEFSKFCSLSIKCCDYTKDQIIKFGEKLWQDTISRQYQLEGYTEVPIVSTTKLKFDLMTSRKFETLFLSLFYPNNIMEEFLYSFDSNKFGSPICGCGRGEQNSMHLLTDCGRINESKRVKMTQYMDETPIHNTLPPNYASNQFLVSWSRQPQFFQIAVEIIIDAEKFYRSEVVL